MATIHPSAILDPSAEVADDVEIGPYAVVEADVTLGPGCVVRPHAIIRRYTSMGEGNYVDSFAVLGGQPQDLKFCSDGVSHLRIGDHNTFREHVTISRGTEDGSATTVGNRTYWMANSHAGHNAAVGDECVLVNGAKLAGHSRLGHGVIMGGGAVVHQFCWVGDRVMMQGNSGLSMHAPPFTMLADVNEVVGLNTVGLRRAAGVTPADRREVQEMFRVLYRSGRSMRKAVEHLHEREDWGESARQFLAFLDEALAAEPPFRRGICPRVSRLERRRGGSDCDSDGEGTRHG